MKRCKSCGEDKEITDFSLHPASKDGRNPRCKACKNREASAYYQANQEEITRKRKSQGSAEKNWEYDLKRKFGITRERYEAILDEQGGVCAICKVAPTTKRLAVDHDHQTGEVRGLLCLSCNMGLGYFKDSKNRLVNAIHYLG